MAFRDTALRLAEPESVNDDSLWAERGEYWRVAADPPDTMPSLWDRRRAAPLTLSGHGVRLRIRHGALEIRHGMTHHPQEPRTQLLFPAERRMPSRIVLVDADGFVTLDVAAFLARHNIPLVMLDHRGRVISTLEGTTAVSNVRLRDAQLEAIVDGRGLAIATDLIREKVVASTETLKILPPTPRVARGLERLDQVRRRLFRTANDVDALRMIEAQGAVSYFSAWLDVPMRWKGTNRRPVPREWARMPLRSSLLGGSNRHATHPVGSMLNYAYGVLESQVRQTTLAFGLDPAIGYLHVARGRRDALVLDLMEPFRPVVDRGVLKFVQHHTFSAADVFLTEKGVCRLHPQLARVVAGLVPTEPSIRDGIGVCVLPLSRQL